VHVLADVAHVLDDILDGCSITSKTHGDVKCITRFHPKKILDRQYIGKRMKEVAKKIDVIAGDMIKFGLHVGVMERQPEDEEWRQLQSSLKKYMEETKIKSRLLSIF